MLAQKNSDKKICVLADFDIEANGAVSDMKDLYDAPNIKSLMPKADGQDRKCDIITTYADIYQKKILSKQPEYLKLIENKKARRLYDSAHMNYIVYY